MTPPEFVTFTGLDDRTDLDRALSIAQRWPVEFAVLLSAGRQGKHPRYPSPDTISAIAWRGFPRLAVHMCGEWSRQILSGVRSVHGGAGDLGAYVHRVQVNSKYPDAGTIRAYAKGWGLRGIAQARGPFPSDTQIDWLFDCSGGRGEAPRTWPTHPGHGRLVGYAGGITPENVSLAIAEIRADGTYWLDMESGIRTDDWLDLDKCEAVCAAAFSAEQHSTAVASGRSQEPGAR
jgi:hypothetical protein